jgi:GTP-binding protein
VAQIGLNQLLYRALEAAQRQSEASPPETAEEMPVYRPEPGPEQFEILREADGSFRVQGDGVERAAAMTYWEYPESVRRFQQLLQRLGVERALQEAGVNEGETVHIGEYELEWQE